MRSHPVRRHKTTYSIPSTGPSVRATGDNGSQQVAGREDLRQRRFASAEAQLDSIKIAQPKSPREYKLQVATTLFASYMNTDKSSKDKSWQYIS